MTAIWLSIAPIFVLVLLGHALRRGSIPSGDFWNVIDRLVYWVLLPSLLFYKMSMATFDPALVSSYSIVIIGSFFGVVTAMLLLSWLFGLSGPAASSVLQGAARHNTFIALAVAERLYGVDGLELAILAAAMLIPITNLSIVPLVIMLVSGAGKTGVWKAVLKDIVRNPLLLSVALGLAVNLSWGSEIPVLHDTVRILGGAALPIVLLTVGASLRLDGITTAVLPIALSGFGKMLVFPFLVCLGGIALGFSQMQLVVAMLFGAAPTATSAYTLARQLGGDAPLMAAIMTIQTGLAFLTLPITLALVALATG